MPIGLKYEKYIPEWKELYESGMSFRQIGLKYGVDAKTVNRTLSGVIEKRPKSYWGTFADDWYDLFTNEGYSKTDIARKYSTHVSNVTKVLQQKGIKPEMVSSKRKYQHLVNDFVEMYTKGYSLADIAEKHGIDKQTVSNYLESSGIERRSLSESIRVYEINEHYFDNIDSKEKAYHLGLLYATGSLLYQHNGYTIQITTHINSRHIIEPLLKVLRGSDEGIYIYKDNVCRVRFNSEHLHHTLKNLGFDAKLETRFPLIEDIYYAAFVAGYFENNFSNVRNDMHISGAPQFLEQLKESICQKVDIEKNDIKIYVIGETEYRMAIYKKETKQKITEWLLFDSGITEFKNKVQE